MHGKVSGRVARIERKDDVTILTLVGEHQSGRPPHITNVRFPGRSAEQVRETRIGDGVICDAKLIYRQWRSANGEARAENTTVGLTCYSLAAGLIVESQGYLALKHAVCQYDLLAYVVRVESAHQGSGASSAMRVRVWCKDDQGERHYYTVDFRGAQADAARAATPGAILHLTVTARKFKRANGGWGDQVDALSTHVCQSRVRREEARPVESDFRTAPVATPAPAATVPAAPMPRSVTLPSPMPGTPRPVTGAPTAPRAPRPNIAFTPAALTADDLADLMPSAEVMEA